MTRSNKSWPNDINDMHMMMRMDNWMDESTPELRKELMKLRMRMLMEEFTETMDAYLQGDVEEVIDGLTDLCVIAVGTMDLCGVNADLAWDRVHGANMDKSVGRKPGRPNPLGLPDLVKPDGWTAPSHKDNHGSMEAFM